DRSGTPPTGRESSRRSGRRGFHLRLRSLELGGELRRTLPVAGDSVELGLLVAADEVRRLAEGDRRGARRRRESGQRRPHQIAVLARQLPLDAANASAAERVERLATQPL